ncbi:MAG: amidohydrolase [Chitinophagales bacterium]|nr:amidohydrolase [Chitinophagales bacterium]
MQKILALVVLIFLLNATYTGAQSIDAAINQKSENVLPKVIEWRRYFHEHPELSNREFQTSAYVAAYLKTLGLEVRMGIAKTGVVAILKGGKPGPVIALRADMDALPLTERTNVTFASHVTSEFNGAQVGVMHACGHDSHLAMLMGTATVLSDMKKDVQGTIVFLFQPAEEGAPGNEEGGAALMVKEGALDNPKVEAVFGLHIKSNIEIGTINYRSGAFMASSDWFTIKVTGKGAHGSQPWNGIDPIVVASQIIEGLQTIVSRQENIAKAPVVITIGKIEGGVRNNIIPETVTMDGTIRTLDTAMQQQVHRKIIQTATKIAEASGALAEVTITTKTLVTYNDQHLVKMMEPSLEKAIGKDHVVTADWTTEAEDFSYYSTKAPSFFFFVGGMPKGADPKDAPGHHTAAFYIDDSRLDVGVKAFCHLAFDYPERKK